MLIIPRSENKNSFLGKKTRGKRDQSRVIPADEIERDMGDD
jgi:hypothetical protein